MTEADWARFRELVTGVGEDELAAVLRDFAALLQPVTMGEEEFAVILRDHAAFLRSGRTDEEPTLAVKKLIPSPLAWRDDVLLAVTSVLGFPEPTPEAKVEAEREAKLFKAIESGAIDREKPGRKSGETRAREDERAIAQACLDEAGGHSGKAKRAFIKQICPLKSITEGRADNLWYEVTESAGRSRRVR